MIRKNSRLRMRVREGEREKQRERIGSEEGDRRIREARTHARTHSHRNPKRAGGRKMTHSTMVRCSSGRSAGAVTSRRQTASSRGGRARAVRARASAEPRPVQIIPSVLPADWANMGQYVQTHKMRSARVFSIFFCATFVEVTIAWMRRCVPQCTALFWSLRCTL